MRTWVDRFPGRLQHELAEFGEYGLEFELDESQLEQQGRVVLRGALPYDDRKVELEVRYPDLFPHLRPEVLAPELRLGRHQNPYDKNLCLLDPSTREWDSDASAAWLVAERVPYLLSLLSPGAEAELREAETPQGEPASAHFPSLPGTVVFVPDAALGLPDASQAGSGRIAFSVAEPPRLELRGLLAELVEKRPDGKTKTLARAEEPLARHFGGEQIPFRWVRLPEAPASNTVNAVLEAVEAARPGFGLPPWHAVPGGQVAIAAAVFSEEIAQSEFGDAWIFAVRLRRDSQGEGAYLIRGQRLSRGGLEDRLPVAVRLGTSAVSLIGLGSVGAGLGLELARAGLAELRGMDPDTVEAGTAVRWPLGQSATGRWKAGAIARRMAQDYPYTEFKPVIHGLGQSALRTTGRERTELEVLDLFLSDTDLLVDATAEIGVQHVLAELASERGIPQLFVSTTEGARGGLVARILPGITGCWLCLQHHLEDNEAILAPARDEAATVQPRGCAAPTFVGAGFDILPVIAQGARVATATLSEDWQGQVQELDRHDVFVYSFGEDRLLPPRWSTHTLTRHPDCEACAEREA